MSNREILTRAIEKALGAGWTFTTTDYYLIGKMEGTTAHVDGEAALRHYPEIIFNHDFAKALWGDISIFINGDPFDLNHPLIDEGLPHEGMWQYHLQQMVIADDPIKYLGENI